MKLYSYLAAFLSLSLLLSSCDWLKSSSEVDVSTDASFVSLTFAAAVDDDDAVKNAVFDAELDPLTGDSLIVNTDSLPYNTAIDSVIPTFSFQSHYATYVYRNDENGSFKDSVLLTGTDTLNFNRVYKVRNIASDGKTSLSYRIKVNVHKVEPDLFTWKRINNEIYSGNASVQKSVIIDNKILFFTGNGLRNYLCTSSNGAVWSSQQEVSGLPESARLRDMVVYNNKIYLIHADSLIYSSSNGTSWTKGVFTAKNYWFKNLLYDFNGKLWALIQTKTDSKYSFANSTDGINWIMAGDASEGFPVGGYSAVAFQSRTKVPKVIVAGGYDKNGNMLNKVWSSEDGVTWFDFSRENTTFGYRSGASMIYYEDKLLVFGGLNQEDKMPANLFIQSVDEGYSWRTFDTTYMRVRERIDLKLPSGKDTVVYEKYSRKYNQTVVVDKNKFIYLIGGRDSLSNIHKDVWRGRLNKSVF